jgi:hypothetical protein
MVRDASSGMLIGTPAATKAPKIATAPGIEPRETESLHNKLRKNPGSHPPGFSNRKKTGLKESPFG